MTSYNDSPARTGKARSSDVSTPPPMAGVETGWIVRTLSGALPSRFVSGAEIVVEDFERSRRPGPASGRRMAYTPGLIVADKYELLRPLGSGGMGEVWVAHHLSLDIDVAVKFIGRRRRSGIRPCRALARRSPQHRSPGPSGHRPRAGFRAHRTRRSVHRAGAAGRRGLGHAHRAKRRARDRSRRSLFCCPSCTR